MATLLAITYPDAERAKKAMESIDWSDFDRLIDVKEACWVTKEGDQLKVHQRGHPGAVKAALGGTLGLLVGGLFAIPVVGIAAGTAIGIHKGRQKDTGIDDSFVTSVGEEIESGGSAVFVLYDGGADNAKAASDLAQFGGTLHSADLPPDVTERFQKLLDKGN